ncbi:DUF5753 domain-containing protein [Streptomyces longispororuber]|uniref:DUF5753 domain-containing protein n=1 Tax=Streptomyces longispororuber TaxID=68230 RepID=UPI0036FB52A0
MPAKTPALRRLALALRRLRQAAGLEFEEVIDQSPVSKSTLRRAEKAEARPNRSTLYILLNLYNVDDATRAEVEADWEEAGNQNFQRPFHADLRPDYRGWIACEESAEHVKEYESHFVPGLGQTREYAHCLIQGVWPSASPTDLEHHVQARIDRQAVLTKPKPLRLTAVIDQAALHRVVGSPRVMAEQMRHLQALATQPNIGLRVIPFAAGAHSGMPGGSLAIATFAKTDEPGVVYLDSMAGDALLDSEQDFAHYSDTFESLAAKALDQDESLALIAETEQHYTRQLETA